MTFLRFKMKFFPNAPYQSHFPPSSTPTPSPYLTSSTLTHYSTNPNYSVIVQEEVPVLGNSGEESFLTPFILISASRLAIAFLTVMRCKMMKIAILS